MLLYPGAQIYLFAVTAKSEVQFRIRADSANEETEVHGRESCSILPRV